MGTSHNPYKPGDRVEVSRGAGRLAGTVVKTVLARCHVELDDSGRVVVDDYKEIRRAES